MEAATKHPRNGDGNNHNLQEDSLINNPINKPESNGNSGENERYVTLDKFNEIVKYAQILQQAELASEHCLKGLEHLIGKDTKNIPVSTVNQVVDELMPTGKPYFQKAMDLLYPSREKMESDLALASASPTDNVITEKFRSELQKEFNRKLPGLDTVVRSEAWITMDIIKVGLYGARLIEKRPFPWTKLIQVKQRYPLKELAVAEFSYQDYGHTPPYVSFVMRDPLFLNIAGEKFEELKKWLSSKRPNLKVSSSYSYQTN